MVKQFTSTNPISQNRILVPMYTTERRAQIKLK